MKKLENRFFRVIRYAVNVHGSFVGHNWVSTSQADIKVEVLRHDIVHHIADGNGPVNAIDNALRRALVDFFPEIAKVRLVGYQVHKENGDNGTESSVEVKISSSDGKNNFLATGVSVNSIEASFLAVVNSLETELSFLSER